MNGLAIKGVLGLDLRLDFVVPLYVHAILVGLMFVDGLDGLRLRVLVVVPVVGFAVGLFCHCVVLVFCLVFRVFLFLVVLVGFRPFFVVSRVTQFCSWV